MSKYTDRLWLKNYPPQVPADILIPYDSLVEMFEESCQKFSNRIAFSNYGNDLTYSELYQKTEELASYFQNDLKLKKGDFVAIMMPNLLQYPITLFAILRAGLIAININPNYTPTELKTILKDSIAETIVITDKSAQILKKVLLNNKIKNIILTKNSDLFEKKKNWFSSFKNKIYKKIKFHSHNLNFGFSSHEIQRDFASVETKAAEDQEERLKTQAHTLKIASFHEALKNGKQFPLKRVKIESDDIALLQYTGGTTGISKGAILTHQNLVANIIQIKEWFSIDISESKPVIIVTPIPVYHIFALVVNLLTFIALGGQNILITNPKELLNQIKNYRFNIITGVPTLFNNLLNQPEFHKMNFDQLKYAITGGMNISLSIAEKWFKTTGSLLINAYGMSESAGAVTCNRLDSKVCTGSIGLPLPSTEISLHDERGNEVEIGERGELCIKGPQVTKGYWKQSDNKDSNFRNGWFCTGDIATMDQEGYLYIVDRKKDLIIVAGFNVYPNEVEDILMKHPGVFEAAIVGLPDDHTGEQVKAFIVKKDQMLTQDEIIAYCREHLSNYKIPKQIEFCDHLPKSNIGKILRRELRAKKIVEPKAPE